MKIPTPLRDHYNVFLASRPDKDEIPKQLYNVIELAFLCGAMAYRKADSDTADNPLLHMYLSREINDWLIKLMQDAS